MTRESYAIEVEFLSKTYSSHGSRGKVATGVRPAVDGISFTVKRGEIFGLLGPNGAGKTTTIKMLSTLLLPTSGTALVLGLDVQTRVGEIRKRINLVSGGERGLYYRLTGRDNLRFFADLYRVPKEVRDRRVTELLELVGLASAADRRVEEYSRGMKQRLHIARGLVNDPELLFLDEPTIGLDPEISCEIRGMIDRLSKEGKTILLTTHDMREADQLCDHINVISEGRIIASGDSPTLKELVKDESVIEIEVRNLGPAMIESVRSIGGVIGVQVNRDAPNPRLRVKVHQGPDLMVPIAARLEECGLLRISKEEPTLEDAYLRLVMKDD
jgi:ABC-2 type transport system ATP-binding protein